MNWISCKDKMPKRNETVLVVYGRHIDVATFYSDYWNISGDQYGCELDRVSHWMPFPDLPESVKREVEEFERENARRMAAAKQAELEVAKREFERAQELASKYGDE